jgi:hypothetical protein
MPLTAATFIKTKTTTTTTTASISTCMDPFQLMTRDFYVKKDLQSNNNNHEQRHMMERLLLATKCT